MFLFWWKWRFIWKIYREREKIKYNVLPDKNILDTIKKKFNNDIFKKIMKLITINSKGIFNGYLSDSGHIFDYRIMFQGDLLNGNSKLSCGIAISNHRKRWNG